jgi:uncharacterized protein (TIGR02996 family)
MSTYEELLEHIAAEPANDEPRLVCADLLTDSDPARAELIHAQVALGGRVDPARRKELQRKVDALLAANAARWRKPLDEAKAADVRFTRGFVEEAALNEESLAKHGAALFAREPLHRLRVVAHHGRALAQAAAQPWFSRVRQLSFIAGAVDTAVKVLAAAPHAGKLRGLLLSGASDAAVLALAGSEALPGLRSLSLGSSELSDEAAAALGTGKLALERLYLSGTGLSDEGAAGLAEGKALASLRLLALNRNSISDEGAEALAKSKALTALERLELSKNELSEEGALAFRSPKALPKLRRLELRGMGLGLRELEPLRKRLGPGLRL